MNHMKEKYLCTYSSLRGKLFLFSQGDQHSAIITSVLVRVGHGLKEMLIVNGARGYRWRGLALKGDGSFAFSHSIAAQKMLVQLRLLLLNEGSISPEL